MQIKTNGIILQDRMMQEEDRLLTILTEDFGILNAYAKGARRFKTKMASATEVLTYSELILFYNKERYTLDDASSKHIFFGLRSDILKLSLGYYFAQLMEELAPRGENAKEYLRLFLNTLAFLESNDYPSGQLKPIFELRLLSMSGYMPDLVACRECMCYESSYMLFHPFNGNLLCSECAQHTPDPAAIAIPNSVLTAMRHIIYTDLKRLFSFRLPQADLQLLQRVSETYLLTKTERNYASLEYYKSLEAPIFVSATSQTESEKREESDEGVEKG